MDPVLKQTIRRLMQIRLTTSLLVGVIRVLRSLLLAIMILYLWSTIRPEAQSEALVLSFIALVLGLVTSRGSPKASLEVTSFLKGLEIKYPQSPLSAFRLKHEDAANRVWYPLLLTERQDFTNFEFKRLTHHGATLVIPAILCLLASQASPGAISTAFFQVQNAMAQLNRGTSLHVMEGLPEAGQPKEFRLDRKTVELTLLEQNMIEIKVRGGRDEVPFVKVEALEGGMVQSFRLTPSTTDDAREQGGQYRVSFTVSEDSNLFVSSVSVNEPAAKITIKKLPVPQVSLEVVGELREPWPDDQPLPLRITAKGEYPLQLIRLQIRADQQTYSELVNNILAQDKKEVTSEYSLLLETYLRQDLSEVEIVAEAIDRHLPNPLLGRSRPLYIRTASAYGRYRETLQSLREIKSILDEAVTNQKDEVDPKLADLSEKAVSQAEESPFFDGLDRHILRNLSLGFQKLETDFDRDTLYQVSEELNRFLFEHETLDDRERDRDFFVAARSLSRLVEEKPDQRALPVETVTERMKSFLNERQQRWEVRNRFLAENAPQQWQEVQKKPFHKSMDEIASLSQANQEEQALQRLSKTVSDYRDWIESLESAEEQKRQQMEEQRQQGLADARQNLRELQKRQGKVSQELDQAAVRPEQELANQWASTRMEQNSNIQGTKSLEAQLRSVSPMASERIKAAVESMELTVSSGNQQAFAQAESASDLAGRLLRQADSAARRSQQQRQERGRRRRVTSDQYYGSPVAGGDVEIRREYQVNPRYREDILDQVRRAKQDGKDDDRLLESYLRQVIR